MSFLVRQFLRAILVTSLLAMIATLTPSPAAENCAPAGAAGSHHSYEAQIDDYTKIDLVEERMVRLAQRWALELFEKDRDQMAFLTQGNPALFMALCYEEQPVLNVFNVGVGETLVVAVSDFGEMPRLELERLTHDVLTELEALGLKFRQVDEVGQPEQR